MHDAIVRLPLCLLADSRLDYFPEAGLVVGMKPLKEVFESGQTILWIETQNTVAFLRPVPDILLWTPGPTAGLAQPLRFRQVRFTYSDLFLGALLFAQVEDERDTLASTFKQRTSNQHGHAAAIFPEKLLLVWLNCPCRLYTRQFTFVTLMPFGRCQVSPKHSTRDQILTGILQHAQKGFIGIDDTLAFDVSDENPQNVGVDQSTDLVFEGLAFGDVGHSPDKLAVAKNIQYCVSYRMDVLDSPVRQQQAILVFEISARLGCVINHLLYRRPILRMYALHR